MSIPPQHNWKLPVTCDDLGGHAGVTRSEVGRTAGTARLGCGEDHTDAVCLGFLDADGSMTSQIPVPRATRARPPQHLPCDLSPGEGIACMLGGGDSTTPTSGRIRTPRDSGYATESPAYLGTNTQFRFDEDSASFHELDDIEEDDDYDDVFLSPDQEQPVFTLGSPCSEDEDDHTDHVSTSYPHGASNPRPIPVSPQQGLRLMDMPFTPPRAYLHQRYSTGCMPPDVAQQGTDMVDGGRHLPRAADRDRLRLQADGHLNGQFYYSQIFFNVQLLLKCDKTIQL